MGLVDSAAESEHFYPLIREVKETQRVPPWSGEGAHTLHMLYVTPGRRIFPTVAKSRTN
jgi:hypothetical protein